MWQQAGPIAYTLFVWWFSTGAILYLVGMPRSTHRWTMLGATLLLGVAFCGLAVTASDTRISGAYLAFTSALVIWGWQEVAFLLGVVTGPRRLPCPEQAAGWRRAGLALQAVLYHEVALLLLGAAVITLTWGAPNQVGTWTYFALWVMRQSAKLNVFLGVRNLNEHFLPAHLAYMHSYFRCRPMNRLFPVSVFAFTMLTLVVWQSAWHPALDAVGQTARVFVAALLTLGVLEHWFLVLPLPTQALWNWGLRSRGADVR
jgi:putative photosynthetic complex assembly protein 2